MKNKKRVIEVITEYPEIIYTLKTNRQEEPADYILDASNYSQPTTLLATTNPDILLLNLKLPFTSAIELVSTTMDSSNQLKVGLITKDRSTFYARLCASFGETYLVDPVVELKRLAGVIGYKQLN